MKPILFEADTLNYSNNGIGVLYDVIRLEVEEERNGYFGLEMEYPVDGEWFKELKDQRLILAKPNDVDEPHVFRIYEIDKNLEDGVVYILANTITDDLSGNLVIDGVVKDATAQMALNKIRTNLIEPTHFDFVSDIQTKSSSSWTRINPLQAIAGVRGSLVDLWGGEIKRTNKTLYLFSRRGKDKVATIRPGKNIDGFNMVVSTKGMITRILPFFEYSFQGLTEYEMVRDYDGNLVKQAKYTTNSSETEPTTVLGDVVVSDLANKYPVNYHEPIDFSSDEDITEKVEKFINDKEEELKNSPTIIDTTYFEDELKDYVKELVDDRASRYFTYDNPGVDKPNVEINVDILQLSDSPEWEKYKKLEHIQLTDTVEIYVRKFDVDVEVTISAIVYDSIGERVVSITAGSIQTSLSDSIKKEYEDTNLKMEQYYNSMVNGIQNTIMRTADGLNNKFTGYTEPPADISSEGDLWFKLVGEGQVEIYIYTGGKWDPVISEAVFDALEQDMEQAMIDVQDAKNRADEAYTNANIATQKAIESIGIAQEGFDAAQDALETATLSDGKAEQALTKAQDGFDKAQQAITSASGADSKAEQALVKAQEGFDKAQESFDKIDNLTIGARNYLANKNIVDNSGIVYYIALVDRLASGKVKSVTLSTHGYLYGYDNRINLVFVYDNYITDPNDPTAFEFIENPTLPYTHTVEGKGILYVYVGNFNSDLTSSVFPLTKQQLIDAKFKLETGTVPTDWTPAPEDTDQKISVIADDLDGLSVEVSNNKGEISSVKQTTQGLQTKVENVEGNISDLIQTADGLQSRVTNAEGEISTVKQTAQGLQSRVETVENWEIGGRNLVPNTSNDFIAFDSSTMGSNWGDWVSDSSHFYIPVEAGETYTARIYMKAHKDNVREVGLLARLTETNSGSTVRTEMFGTRIKAGEEGYSHVTFTVPDNRHFLIIYSVRFNSSATTRERVEIRGLKVEKGNKPTDWSPAPEDTEQKFTSITQTVNGIQTEVGKKVDNTTYNSKMTQLDSLISQKISTVDANNKFATQSALTQTSNSLNSTISRVANIEGWKIGGTNLFQTLNLEQGTFSASTGEPSGSVSTRIRSKDFIELEGGEYIASSGIPCWIAVYQYREDKSFIGSVGFLSVDSTGTIFNLNQDTKYVKFLVRNSDANADISTIDALSMKIMFEKGNKATDWSPSPTDIANGITIGGRNLITLEDPTMSGVTKNGYVYRLSKTGITNPYIRIPYTLFENETDYVISFKTKKISGSVYSMAGHVESIPDTASTVIILDGNEVSKGETWSTGNRNHPDDTETHEYEIRFKTTNNVAGGGSTKYWYIQPNRSSYSSNFVLDIWDWKLEKGTKKTGWSPAPEDYEQKFTAINQDINSISTRVQTNANNYSSLSQTVGGIQTTVSNKADKSQVTQLANVVDTKISTVDANNKFATQSQLTQTSNSLTSIIQKASTGGGDNLVSDGSFEYDGLGWESHSRFSIVKTDKYSGEKSLRVTAGSGTAQFKLINDIPVTPGRTYEASIWYKTSSDANGTAANQKLRVGTPSGGTTSMTLGFTGASTTWKKLTGRYTAVSSSPYLIVSIVANHTSGIVYWDDVSIRDVTDIADAQSEISTINQTVSGIATQVSKKVDQTTYNTYVQQTANTLAAKINTTTADGKYATKTALTATADGIQTEVNKKVNTTTYNSKMTQLDSAIQARITTATADGKYTAQTTFTQTVNSITGRIDSMEAISGNLVNNPVVTGNHSGWTGSGLSSVNRAFEGVTDRVLQSSTSSDTQYYSSYFDVDPSKTYEVSMWISKSASGQYYVGLNGLNSSGSTVGFVAVNSSGKVSNANNTNFYFRSGNVGTSWIHVVGYIMPVGTKPSTMRNMGTATNNAIMKQNVRRIRVRFLNWSNGGTTRQLWVANPKVVEVSSGVFSQTSQLQDAINLRVQKNDVVNQLNIDTSGILLQGKKISLDGDTTVLGTFRVANANITSLTGNKITSGTINAANVNIINMNASNISTGYLNVDRLNGNISTFIQSNWNSLTSEVSITASGLKTYSNGQQTSLLNGSGHRFYRNNMFIGHIGTSNWSGDASYRGLRFGLENNADYMSWGFTKTTDATIYTTMLAWHKTGSKSNKGFTFSDNVRISSDYRLGLRYLHTIDYAAGNRALELSNYTFTHSVPHNHLSYKGVSIGYHTEFGGRLFLSTNRAYLIGGNSDGAHVNVGTDNDGGFLQSQPAYSRTSSGSPNLYVTPSGTFYRSTSASKYKLLIENEENKGFNYESILDLSVKSWYDKATAENYSKLLESKDVIDVPYLKRHFGLIAEDVERVGLSQFVTYGSDENGKREVEGIEYDRLWVLLIPIIRKQRDEISDIKQQYETQQQVIDNLQLKIAQMEAAA